MIRDVDALEDRHSAAHPHIVSDDDILVVLGELVLIGERHHGPVEDIGAMVAGNHGQVGAAHEVVTDANLRAGREQRGPGAQVYVVAHVNVPRPGDLTVATERNIMSAFCERATKRGQQEQLIVGTGGAIENPIGDTHGYAFLHTILSTTPV